MRMTPMTLASYIQLHSSSFASAIESRPRAPPALFTSTRHSGTSEQNAATDDAERQEIVQQMLTILYEDAPYLNTVYDTIGEAYRSDRWEGFVPQPNPGGILLFQYGHANYLNVAPAGTASGTPGQAQESDDAGSGQVMLIVLVIALAGAAVVGGWLFMRRRTADDRE